MMADNVTISDLASKIELLLRYHDKIRTKEALIKAMGIGKDQWSRIQAGTRVLTEEKFNKLCDIFGIPSKQWYHPLERFGSELGFTRYEVAAITKVFVPGIDFMSRISDDRQIENLFSVIKGYWESFYFSVSKIDKPVVSRDLLVVNKINEDKYIECEIYDSVPQYTGWCFPTGKMLYFMLEKSCLFDEIIVYATNLPNRQPPRLYGVILCLSGDVDEVMQSLPCAAKVAFRYLGTEEEARTRFSIPPDVNVEDFLRKEIPGFIDPACEDQDEDTKQIIHDISNFLPAGAVPAALRMDITRRSPPK